MKLNALNSLIAAVEEGSLRSAAQRIGTSQPALTKIIRELELELGTSLLLRSSKGVQPTPQGKVLYERALKASRELSLAVDEIQQLDGHMTGDLHISAVPVAVVLLIPELLRTFGHEFPDVRLRVSEELYVAQLQRLRTQEVEVTVGGIPDDLPPGEFYIERLMQTVMVPTVRAGSPLLEARCLADLQKARWVFTGAQSESGYAKLLFERHGLEAPPVGAVVNSTLTLMSVVSSGDYVALMPQQIAMHDWAKPLMSIIPIEERGYPLEIGAMVRSDTAPAPLVRQVFRHLLRAAHQVDRVQEESP